MRQAAALGLPAIACTDHMPLRQPPPGVPRPADAPAGRQTVWHMAWNDLPAYVAEIERLQAAVPQIEVLLGLECDYWPGVESHIALLRESYPFDLFLGSIHLVGDFGIDSEEEVSRWEQSDPDVVWEQYFTLLAEAASSGLYDIIGHADVVKKFGFRPKADTRPWVMNFLDAARASGVAIELNTAGLRKPCAAIYPDLEILRLACARGVPIAFGSDAHRAEHIGVGFREAVDLARAAGYREYARFGRGRRREMLPLPS